MKNNYCLFPPKKNISRRTFFTIIGSCAFFFPVLRFVGFTIPRKPTYVEIHKAIPTSGFLVTAEFILFDRDNKYWALSRKCTHLGCKLNYREDMDIIECPCHQSRFNVMTGAVIQGPAQKSLSFLEVEKRLEDPHYVVTT